MGLWSTLEGIISIHKDAHFSVTEAIYEYLGDDEIIVKLTTERHNENRSIQVHHVWVNWEMDGMIVAKHVEKLVQAIKAVDKKSKIDLQVNIRWVE